MGTWYQYTPLASPEEEVRVAVLQCGAYSDELRLSFQIRILQKEGPAYEALSYAWGTEAKQHRLNIYEESNLRGVLPITQNLDLALRHLRYLKQDRCIWADAICIDQSSIEEKNKQVASMSKIYASASQVVIWIGPETEDSNKALAMVQEAGTEKDIPVSSKDSSDPHEAAIQAIIPYYDQELDAVCNLITRPYWERLWIRQEIAFATSAVLQCGDQILPWKVFMKGILYLSTSPKKESAISKDKVLTFSKAQSNLQFLFSISKNGLTWQFLRQFTANTRCADSRDIIYAMTAIIEKTELTLGIEVDYHVSKEELFTQVARRFIETYRRLDIIFDCELATRRLDIPSWVPDFTTTPMVVTPPIHRRATANAALSAHYMFHDDNRTLSAAGVEVACIEDVTLLEDLPSITHFPKIQELIQKIARTPRAEADKVSSYETFLERYSNMLVSPNLDPNQTHSTDGIPSRTTNANILSRILSLEEPITRILASDDLYSYICDVRNQLAGRCFFSASNNCFGLAPNGTQPGDIIAVLLGLQFPIVLRPCSTVDSDPSWNVVGVCYADGFMHGQAILWKQSFDTLYDPDTWRMRAGFHETMEELGATSEDYDIERNVIHVRTEKLVEYGVPLQTFVLV